jgi:hypothetical protein
MPRALRIWELSTAALFGIAVVAKAWDPADTIRSLGQVGLGVIVAYVTLSLVVLAEIVVATRLIVLPGQARSHYAAVAILALFTCYLLLVKLTVSNPTGCGCGSILSLGAVEGHAQIERGVFRNLSFIVALPMARLVDATRLALSAKGARAS